MGAAAAAENPQYTDNATMKTTDDATPVVSENTGGAEPLLGASNLKNFTTLYNEINNVESGTIRLDGTYAFDEVRDASFVNGVVISKNVTIDGNGAVIDGSGKARIFYVPDTVNSFTLKDITIKNAYTTGDGAVALFQENMKNVEIEGTFINNTASNAGVFSFAGGVSGKVDIDGTFTDNTALTNAAVFRFNSVTDSVINIKGNYHNNRAKVAGVIWFVNGISDNNDVNIIGEFINNHATNTGGILHVTGAVNGNVTLKGTYEGNTANNGGVAYVNGAVNGNVTLKGTYEGNTANSTGGVAYVNGAVNGNVTLNGTFTGNTATSSGGVAYVNGVVPGNMTFIGDFTSNNAGNGAILKTSTVTGKVDFTKANIKDNTANWTSNAMVVVPNTQENVEEHILYDESRVSGNNAPMIRMASGFTWSNVPNNWYVGKILNTTVTVSGVSNPKGLAVNLTDNGTFIGTYYLDENATVNIIFTLDTPGKHNLFAQFTGSDLYAASSSSAIVTVNDGDNLKTYTDLVNQIMNADGPVKLEKGIYVYDPVLDKDYKPMDLYYDVDIDGNGAVIDGAGFNKQLFNIYGNFNLTNVTVQNVKSNVVVAQNDGLTIKLNGTFTQNTRVLQARHKSMTITLDGTYSYNNFGNGYSASVLDMYSNGGTDKNTVVYLYGDYIGNKGGTNNNGAVAMFSHVKKVVFAGNFINNTGSSCAIAWFVFYGDIEVTGNFTNNTASRLFHIQNAESTDPNISSINFKGAHFINNTATTTIITTTGASGDDMPLVFIDHCLFINNTAESLMTNSIVCYNLTITNNRLYNNTWDGDIFTIASDTVQYANITNNTDVTVDNATGVTDLTLDVVPLTVYGDRNISVSITLTGLTDYTDVYVLLDITGQPTRMVELDSSGKAQLSLGLGAGVYSAVASYEGDGFFKSVVSSPVSFTVKLKQVNAYTFKDLYERIYNGDTTVDLDGDTFLFDPTTDTPYKDGIIVPSGVTIEGHGAVIDADGQSRIFQLTGNNNVNNITFKNAKYSGHGGAIVTTGQNIVISNSTFDSNSATGTGWAGAIYINSQKTRIDSCNFTSNSAVRNGGAIGISQSQVLIINSSFIGNEQTDSRYHAGAICSNAENTAVWYCNFTDNHAAGTSGAVYFAKQRNSISYCNFTNNTAVGQAGALRIVYLRYSDSVSINGSTIYRGYTNLNFTNNTADYAGAMEILPNNNYGATFNNLEFINNSAKTYAGALLLNTAAAVTLNNPVFKNNTAGTTGAAIYYTNGGSVSINNGEFDNNKAESTMSVVNGNPISIHLSGGNSYYDAFYGTAAKTIKLTNVLFDGKLVSETITATPDLVTNLTGAVINMTIVNETGDIIYTTNLITNEAGDVVVDYNNIDLPEGVDPMNTRVLFTFDGNDNYLASNGEGYFRYGDFYLLQKYIDNNITEGNYNIVLDRNYTYDLVLDNVVEGILIKDDFITIDGNGLVVDAQKMSRIFTITGNNVTIKNINLINGTFTGSAGAILISGANATIMNANFTGNTATSGGAVYVNGDNATIKDANFTGNTATNGGAIYLNTDCQVNITGSRFIGNLMSTTSSKGIVYLDGPGNVTGCTFKDNIILGVNLVNAVALQLTGNYKGNVKGNTFSDPMAKYYEISNAGVLTLTNNNILNGKNSAKIYNTNIITNMSAVVLNNRTLTGLSMGNLVVLNATNFKDDKENLIDNTKLTFIVYNETGDVIAQLSASSIEDGVAYANYYIPSVLHQYVTIKDVTPDNVDIGAIGNINPGLCNISIVFDSNPLGYGHNQTVTITLSSNDTVLVPVRNATIKIKVTRESDNTPIFESTNATDSNGVYSFKVNSTDLDYGSYKVNVTFEGNDEYKANSTCYIFIVSKNVPELTVNVNSSKVSPGEPVMLNFTLTSDNKGLTATVSVKINDEDPFNVDITDGEGSVIIPGEKLTTAGSYDVLVTYNGEGDIGSVVNGTNFTVLKVTELTVSADSVVFGDDAVVNIALFDADGNPVDGNVTVKVGLTKKSISVTNGKGSLVVSGLAAGEYPISAEYRGDDTYLKSVNDTESVTVNTINPSVYVTVNGTFTTLDDVIVNITTDTAGTYTITVNGESEYRTLVVGENLVNLGKYSANDYSISVDFAETDSSSAIETITRSFSVVLADTPIVVDDVDISVVDDVMVNVCVPSGLAGQIITIIINGTTKEFVVGSDGNVSANFTGLVKAGSHEITVNYDGDAIYKSNITKAKLTINKINTDLSSQFGKNNIKRKFNNHNKILNKIM